MLKSRLVFFIILILLGAVCIGGCRRAGVWLVKEDVPPHADAMVLLMGNFPERVLQAVDLYHEKRAERLIIVEESMGAYRGLEERGVSIISKSEQARDASVKLGIPEESVTVLPGDARSTLTEAVIVRDYLKTDPDIDTLILVSSPTHMRRAAMIFNKALKDLDRPVYVGCSPSAYSNSNTGRWWRHKEDIQDVLSEYLKTVSFILIEKRSIKRER